jgi:hypothetical protein
LNFFEKIINSVRLCRQGYTEDKTVSIDYAEGRSYADDQIELRRWQSSAQTTLTAIVAYAEGCRRLAEFL